MATNFLLKRSGTASKRPEAASMALGELDLNYDASTGGVFYKDSAGAVVKVGPAQVGSTAPNASPAGSAGNSVGEFWYDTGATALKIWDGSVWVATGGGGGGGGVTSISGTAPITVDNTDPATPIIGVTAASTTAAGVVQLVNSCLSSSCVQAPTANILRLVNNTAVAAIPCSRITTKGTLLVGVGSGCAINPQGLSIGGEGQVLTVCSSSLFGVAWATPGGGGGSSATPTTEGNVFGCTETGYGNSGFGYNVFGEGVLNGSQNTAIGVSAGFSLFGGSENTFIGVYSGYVSTQAFFSTAVGSRALCSNTTGQDNTAVGWSALPSVVTGGRNIGLGYCSGQGYTGSGSVIIGTVSPLSSTNNEQLMIGSGCGLQWLAADCTGAIKPMYGIRDALNSTGTVGQVLSSTGGNQIEWVTPSGGGGGSPATPTTEGLMYGCTAGGNSALGYNALASNLGYSNTAVGQSSMGGITTGYNNVAVGASASAGTLTSSENVTLGSNSGTNLGVSCYNTLVGATTGCFLTTGCYNTLLGSGIYSNIGSGSSNIIISSKDSGGNNNPVYNFSGGENDRVLIGTGETTNAYIQVAWTVVSDARDKMVEGPVPHGLGFVEQLEPKTFYFKENRESDNPNGPKRYGFLAQDILALEGNDAVIIDTEDPEKLKYHGEALVPVLVNAIKELSAEVKSLRAELNQLKSN